MCERLMRQFSDAVLPVGQYFSTRSLMLSILNGFSIIPENPFALSSSAISSALWAVSAIIGVVRLGLIVLMKAVVSSPFITGISRSIRIRSKCCLLAKLMASSPLRAVVWLQPMMLVMLLNTKRLARMSSIIRISGRIMLLSAIVT